MAEQEAETSNEFLHEEYTPIGDSNQPGQLVVSGVETGQAAADIIFVQGLASSYAWTWSVEDAEEPNGRYHWLKQKLPQDVPTARILAFEYDSSWYRDPSCVDIEDCAKWLLDCIVRDRRHQTRTRICRLHKRRPIILVGHSFGGLVIKQALVLAGRSRPADSDETRAEYANYMDILSAVSGIVFMGTPHRGTTFTAMATWKMAIGSFLGVATHDELVHLLTLNSPVLRSLHKQFNALLRNELLGVRVSCFFETQNVSVPPRRVVETISAIMDQANNIPMEANHMQLNKFRKGKDKNYDLFLEELQKLLGGCSELADRKFASHLYNDSQASFDLQNLKRWLSPSDDAQGIYHASRLRDQKSAPFTCSWINNNSRFTEWDAAESEAGALWVYGQAGSGKSVLCSYLIDTMGNRRSTPSSALRNGSEVKHHTTDDCETSTGNTVLYFLNGIDKEHERPWNFLGTLVHQLLAANAQNDRLFKIALEACAAHRNYPKASLADHEVLRSLLQKLLLLQQRVYIFIDGLEENNDLPECLKLLSFVRDMSNVKIALFSQDISEVYDPLSTNFIILQPIAISDHTGPDVSQFVDLKVDELVRRRNELGTHTTQIKDKLEHTADGIFQWVNESIRYLSSAAVGTYNFDECLKDMPVGLHSSYEKIFARIARAEPAIRKKVQSALRWLAVPARPLSARELWTAIRLESSTASSVQPILRACSEAKPTDQEIIDELYELLGSLLRVSRATASNEYYVQLIHPSLRVAITGHYVDDNSPAYGAFQFTEETAHAQCARLCTRICADSTLMHGACKEIQLPPLVDYAWTFWAYHSHLASQSIDANSSHFDQMILAICRDTIVFLNAMVEFSSVDLVERRLELDNLPSTMAIKLAQESLVPAVETVVEVAQCVQFSASLHTARKFTDAELVKRPQSQYKPTIVEEGRLERWRNIARGKFVGQPAATMRLDVDSILSQRPSLTPKRPQEAKKLTKAAQALRLVALRFAIEPVSDSLSGTGNPRSLSAIHFLARTANFLEECGNYPYWDLLAPNLVYSSRFAVADGDPFFGPAKYVLQALEDAHSKVKVSWTEDRLQLMERQSSLPLQITTAHQEHVRKIHQMPGSSYIVASTTYFMFNFDNDWSAQLLIEPMKRAHVQGSLLLRDASTTAQNSYQTILSYAPESALRNEYNEYVAAIPQLLKMIYIQYIMSLFEFFGGLTKAALAIQIENLRATFNDIDTIIKMFNALRGEENLKIMDVVSGMALTYVRRRFLPWWSILYTHTTWLDLRRGLRHPAAFLSIDGSITFKRAIWMSGKCFFLEMTYFFVLGCWSAVSVDAALLADSRVWLVTVRFMGAFIVHHGLLLIERCAFRICHSIVTAVATGRVMFSSPESVGGVVSFSIYYWILSAWNLMLNLGRTALTQGLQLGDSWWNFGFLFIQLVMVFGLSRYVGSIGNAIFKLFYPLMLPWWIAVRIFFLPWARILRVFGALSFLGMTFIAILFARQYWKDPYGLQLSLGALDRAKKTIRGEIESYQTLSLRQIGKGLADPRALEDRKAEERQPDPKPANSKSLLARPGNPPPKTSPPAYKASVQDESVEGKDDPVLLPQQTGPSGSDATAGPSTRQRVTDIPAPKSDPVPAAELTEDDWEMLKSMMDDPRVKDLWTATQQSANKQKEE